MTIVDKASESSDPSTYQNQPGSSEAVSPGDMDAGSASWGAVSSLNDVSNHTLSLGPVPGAVVYSSSSVPEKSKPSPQKDQGITFFFFLRYYFLKDGIATGNSCINAVH